jgi:HrpA-like RNA helicase
MFLSVDARDGMKPVGRLLMVIPQIPRRGSVSKAVSDFRAALPIASYAETIAELVRKNQVVMITGETGCGKTTQVPQIIFDDYLAAKKEVRIICTQPRRLSAISVAERVASEIGEPVGGSVGYMIRLETK